MRVEGDEILLSAFGTKLLTVLYKHFVTWLLTLTCMLFLLFHYYKMLAKAIWLLCSPWLLLLPKELAKNPPTHPVVDLLYKKVCMLVCCFFFRLCMFWYLG